MKQSPLTLGLILICLLTVGGYSYILLPHKAFHTKSSIERHPSWNDPLRNLQRYGDSCKADWQCEGRLVCKAGVCLNANEGFGYGEFCGNSNQCLSGLCQNGQCAGSNFTRAIGDPCEADSECRSGLCNSPSGDYSRICVASNGLRGFTNDPCLSNGGCLSGQCQDNRCLAGGGSLSCAGVGEEVKYPSQCCSGQADSNAGDGGSIRCMAVSDTTCSRQGHCRGRVGRSCAATHMLVRNESQCCSEKSVQMAGGQRRCLPRADQLPSPCLSDGQCSANQICDRKEQVCRSRY